MAASTLCDATNEVLPVFEDVVEDLVLQALNAASIVVLHWHPTGSWSCFMTRKRQTVETTDSTAIGALAEAYRLLLALPEPEVPVVPTRVPPPQRVVVIQQVLA